MSSRFTRAAGCATALLLWAAAPTRPALAQTSTGSLRGHVVDETGAVLPGVTLTALQAEAGYRQTTVTRADGGYTLTGLRPGAYKLDVELSGFAPQTALLRVPVGQTVAADFTLRVAALAESIQVEAAPPPVELRSSEVGLNVSSEQISFLPQNSRNFLNFAGLAPGVRLNSDEFRQEFQAGGQPGRTTNVFIDGVSLKNDVLEGGVVGQDASRGNPFPQNAVQEFRVITQNFKAEYQKASSAVITAVTRSGGNLWHGDAFALYQDRRLVALDEFAEQRNQEKPDYSRWQLGASLSGPLAKDKAHFFLSYEGNYQDRDRQVALDAPNAPALLRQYEGTFTSAFRSSLFFGKLSYVLAPDQFLELSGNLRHETDVRNFGERVSFESAENVKQDVGYATAKHRLSRGGLQNEATLSFTRSKWNPVPENVERVGQEYVGLLRFGGRDSEQLFVQKRLSLRDDLSLLGTSWHGQHVFKLGGNLDFLSYDVSKRLFGNPIYRFRSDNGFAFPFEAQYGAGNPDLSADNRQVGLYAQDDWDVTTRLQLNLGLRWDYESDMLNNDYVTPAEVRQALSPFIDARYFTDGSQRAAYLGALQPRVGFSYDLGGRGRTTLVAGFGRYFDRTLYNYLLDERYRLQYGIRTFRFSADGAPRDGLPTLAWSPAYFTAQGLEQVIASGQAPKPEVFLIENDTRPPHSNQWSVGLRHRQGAFTLAATYVGARSRNDLSFIFGNRRADGTCCRELAPQYSNVLLSSDAKQSWFDALYLTVDKPYTARSKWGFSLAYTLADARANGGDLFSLDYPTVEAYPRHPTDQDERHRLVATGIVGLPAALRASAIVTYGSGLPFHVFDASRGFGPNEFRVLLNGGRGDSTQSVDLRLEKDVQLGSGHRLGAVAEVFNVFDHSNYGCYEGFKPPLPEVNARFGQPGCLREPGRRLQFGLNYAF